MKKRCINCRAEFEGFQEDICPWCDSELQVVSSPDSVNPVRPKSQNLSMRTTDDKKQPQDTLYEEKPPRPTYHKRREKKNVSGLSKLLAGALVFMLILFFLSIDVSDLRGSLSSYSDDEDGGIRDTGSLNETYYWMYDGSSYSLTIEIPKENLMKYENKSHYSYDYKSNPEVFRNWITKDDITMVLITQKLIFKANRRNFTDLQTKEFMLKFVQENIEYKADKGDWKYPIETLADSVGDCEDVAFLYGTITEIAGYDSILVNYEIDETTGHLMPAIYSPSKSSGDTIEFDGREYHFAETTNELYTIGMGPDPTKYDYDTFLTVDI